MDDLIAASSLVLVLAVWSTSRSVRLCLLAPGALVLLLGVNAILLVLLAGSSPVAAAILTAAATLDLLALAHLLWRTPQHGHHLDVERWWDRFEREFRDEEQKPTRHRR